MTVQAAVFRAFEFAQVQGQPMTVRDVANLTQISEEGCRVAMKVFKERGMIQRVPDPLGATRGAYYELVQGAQYAGDQRGRSDAARDQLNQARAKPRLWQQGGGR